MIWEDERAARGEQLGFVLHLGDFIYEVVWYPGGAAAGHSTRGRMRDLVRYPHGEKITRLSRARRRWTTTARSTAPTCTDPDLQDARARWPFVCMWDNHEFSWKGWQSIRKLRRGTRPAQTRKVAANQAWFEYQPARVARPPGANRSLRCAARHATRRSRSSTTRPRPRARQPRRHRQPDRSTARCAGARNVD